MRHTEENSIALESLLENLDPDQTAKSLQTIFVGYITSSDYCELDMVERHNVVHTGLAVIDFFKSIQPKLE